MNEELDAEKGSNKAKSAEIKTKVRTQAVKEPEEIDDEKIDKMVEELF